MTIHKLTAAFTWAFILNMAGITAAAQTPKEIFVPSGTDAAYTVHYAPAIRVGDWVFVSGIAAGGPGTVDEQLHRMFDRLRDTLAAAGASLEDVVELQSFHRAASDTAAFQAEFRQVKLVHDEYFTKNYPVWTAVGNSMLLATNALVEMRATAIVGSGKNARIHRAEAQAPSMSPPQVSQFPPAEALDVPVTGVTVPMLDAGGRPAIDIRIDGHGPYRVVLDTGASISVLAPDVIASLGSPSASQTGPVRLDSVQIGGATLRGLTVGRAPALVGEPDGFHGVLSAAAFPGHLVIFDFPKRTVTIRQGELGSPNGRDVFAYSSDEPLPVIPVQIGTREFRVHLDTGDPGIITLPTAAATTVALTGPAVEVGRARTVAGEFPMLEAPTSAPVAIGEFSLHLDHLGFSDLRAGPRAGIGTVGCKALGVFVLTFDASNRRVGLR